MSEPMGLINEYVCEKCGDTTRTINRNEGTTKRFLFYIKIFRSW